VERAKQEAEVEIIKTGGRPIKTFAERKENQTKKDPGEGREHGERPSRDPEKRKVSVAWRLLTKRGRNGLITKHNAAGQKDHITNSREGRRDLLPDL